MKKILSVILAAALVALAFALTSCGNKTDENTIVVGASPTPHAEILNQVKDILAAKGYTLKVVEYDDYVLPNKALTDKQLDANYFQHTPYLNSYNEANGTDLVAAALIHYEPLGVYGNGVSSLSELKDGATIIVPNDGSNETRALSVLAQEGLITLKAGATVSDNLTKLDIVENKGNYDIKEVAADMVPAQLKESNEGSIAVINGNYAIGAGLKIADALAQEDANSVAALTYANIIAVRKGDENSAKTKALVDALSDPSVAEFIAKQYGGAVVSIVIKK